MLKHGEWCWLDDGNGNRVRLIADAGQEKGNLGVWPAAEHATTRSSDASQEKRVVTALRAFIDSEKEMLPFVKPETKAASEWVMYRLSIILEEA